VEVKASVDHYLTQLQLPSTTVTQQEIDTFCKHSAFIKVVRMPSLADEAAAVKQWLRTELQEPGNMAIIYILFRAVDAFYDTHKRYPGIHNDDVEGDIRWLKKSVQHVLSSFDLATEVVPQDSIHEMFVRMILKF
jgi:amyloid beta precursor protein binding protein 1